MSHLISLISFTCITYYAKLQNYILQFCVATDDEIIEVGTLKR